MRREESCGAILFTKEEGKNYKNGMVKIKNEGEFLWNQVWNG